MRKFYTGVVKLRIPIIIGFVALAVFSLFSRNLVAVNYDMNDYLPKDSPSTVSLDIMQEEFEGGIPNARVMVRNVTIPEALEYKAAISAVDGVTSVTWLDDAVSLHVPLVTLDSGTVETYYKDNAALFSVAIEEHHRISAVEDIREIIGGENAMSGSAVSTAVATTSTVSEIRKIAVIAVLFILFVLLLTTNAWFEPLLVLGGLGAAVLINSGSNLIFGEISFVTNAAGSILQLAVSLDYSVFLIHRFEECRNGSENVQNAMVDALCKSTSSILSSGLTTVIGFLALVLMRFRIGPDLGLALAKGVAISLITVFLFMPSLILTTYPLLDRTKHRSFLPDFKGFGKAVRCLSGPMVCILALLIIPVYLASNANEYYFGSSRIFGPETQLGADTEKIESVFGKKDTYVLLIPNGDPATQTRLSTELQELQHVTGMISYVDTVGAEIPMAYLDPSLLSELISGHYSRMVLSVDVPYEGDETFLLVRQIRKIAEEYYPGAYYLAGEGISTYDLMDTITADMVKVNLVAIAAVFLVLLLTLRSVTLPILLVVSIETAIWMNLSVPYFMDARIFYIAYLIISSIQLGATVDYAILLTDRYRENRQFLNKKEAVVETVSNVTVSILTSGSVLTAVGLLLGYISTNQLLAQLGILIGRGAVFSLMIVLFVLPGLLSLFDRLVTRPDKKNTKSNPTQEV